MHKGRVEAFSDGVIAIIITIMVLELVPPHEPELAALLPLAPIFLSYVLSFALVGLYWNNHHHLLQAVNHVNGTVLWANLHLLFWLSLMPFVTTWMGENHFATLPVAAYGFVQLGAGVAYLILTRALLAVPGQDSALATAIGRDIKGKVSASLFVVAVLVAFVNSWVAVALYVLVALIWFVPDQRIERTIAR